MCARMFYSIEYSINKLLKTINNAIEELQTHNIKYIYIYICVYSHEQYFKSNINK